MGGFQIRCGSFAGKTTLVCGTSYYKPDFEFHVMENSVVRNASTN
jgi:hypothetical protein